MHFKNTDYSFAEELDKQDELVKFRDEFVINDPNTIYLDGNSLGLLPKKTADYLQNVIQFEWGERLIRSWNEGWINLPTETGARIAQIIGAQKEEVITTDSTSFNLFKLIVAGLRYQKGRKFIVSDVFNFPSDLYIMQGVIDLLGNNYQITLAQSEDGISISNEAIKSVINHDTAIVSLTHVAFKSAFMYDMKAVTQYAHEMGALALWDLSHSVGAVPLEMNNWDVDLAVGCTYKYLNGGPGSPAFLYVRRDLQEKLLQPVWGWFASEKPFSFDLDFTPAKDITRFRAGSAPIISIKAIEPALDITIEAGLNRLRKKSQIQTAYLIYLADQWLNPLGFTLGTPRDENQRGSHVSLRHPEGYRITRALIESPPPATRVIPDFRTPDNIRLGIAPLYNSYTDIHRAIERMKEIVENKLFEDYPKEMLTVT
jgi:kynureninase